MLSRMMRGINAQAFRALGNRVLTGPFAGMEIPWEAPWDDGNAGCKLLGTYEHELHPAIRHAAWRVPDIVVNVGCAEGYYAIGLARLIKGAAVYAFDIDTASLKLCQDYAQRNGVGAAVRTLHGCGAPGDVALTTLTGRRLYVIDCEGAELELLDLDRVPVFRTSDIIVECHDFLKASISVQLADRLSSTHRVELISPTLPDLEQFQFIKHQPSVMSVLMAIEKRPTPCHWLACWANRRNDDG